MRSTSLALGLVLVAALWCAPTGTDAQATICDSTAIPSNITTQTTTLLIAAVTGKQIFICGITQAASGGLAASGTATFVYGTQTTNPCDTGQTTIAAFLQQANPGTATAQSVFAFIPLNTVEKYVTPASQQVCVITGGSSPTTWKPIIYYAQR